MNKQQLAARIWASANKMRSKIEASEYKDYILGFIFYKYLSDKEEQFMHDNFQQVLGKVFDPYVDASTNCIALALNKEADNTETLALIDKYFYRESIPSKQLDTNPETLFGQEKKTIIHSTPIKTDDWVLLIEYSIQDDELTTELEGNKKLIKKITNADYVAVGIGLTPGAIDIEPAMMSAKYVVIHNKHIGKMNCLKGKPHFVPKKDITDKFFVAKGKGSDLFVVYEIDHDTRPPITTPIQSSLLSTSKNHGYDTRFVRLLELI